MNTNDDPDTTAITGTDAGKPNPDTPDGTQAGGEGATGEPGVKRTRKPRADKGQPRAPREPGAQAKGKGKGKGKRKGGPKTAMAMYCTLRDIVDGTPTGKGVSRQLKALTLRDAVKEVMVDSQTEEGRISHLGKQCQIFALLDDFVIEGEVTVKVRVKR